MNKDYTNEYVTTKTRLSIWDQFSIDVDYDVEHIVLRDVCRGPAFDNVRDVYGSIFNRIDPRIRIGIGK